MRTTLALRVTQSLALTPQLQQAIRLLQLSTLELAQEVEQQLLDNPFLERQEPDRDADADPPAHADTDTDAGQDGDASAHPADDVADRVPLAELDASLGDGGADLDEAAHAGDAAGDAWTRSGATAAAHAEGDNDPLAALPEPASLREHLLAQAAGLRLGELDRAALHALIDSLDDDGLLPEPLPELVEALIASHQRRQQRAGQRVGQVGDEQRAELLQHFHVALRLLQSFDPVGVGAPDAAHCLLLQIKELENEYLVGLGRENTQEKMQADRRGDAPPFALATRLCQRPLSELARLDLKQLARQTGASLDALAAALALIARLTPYPGRAWGARAAPWLIPDVLVRRHQHGGERWLSVQLNDAATPTLRVTEAEAQWLKRHRSPQTAALAQKLQDARVFAKSLQQRHDTLLRVARCIVQRQAGYFWHGERAMRPLVLRDVADELGLHESTISRITTAKALQSIHGTVELKHFFSSSLASDDGATSGTAVRALIRQMIASENPAQPLSDSQLEARLKAQGIACARRTVAKYREAMGIEVAALRKSR